MRARGEQRHGKWIGARVRELRLKRGYRRLTQFAGLLGVSTQQVSKYEQGRDRISFETMIEIADLLKARLEDFVPPREMVEAARRPVFEALLAPPIADKELVGSLRAWPTPIASARISIRVGSQP